MELTALAAHAAAFLVRVSLKTLPLLTAAALACFGLRRASAASRHLLWATTLLGLLCLPVFCLLLPPLAAPMLPAPLPRRAVQAAPLPQEAALPITETPTRLLNTQESSPVPALTVQSPLPDASSLPRPKPALPAAAPKLTGAEWLVAVWSVGVAAMLGRLWLGLFGAVRLVRRSSPLTAGPAAGAAAEGRRRLGLNSEPSLRSGPCVAVPMTFGISFGLIRPVVLLPEGAEAWPTGRLQAVMLHEMGHIQRHDWLLALLAEAVCALYWFHPLVWLAARQMRGESEGACDDLVLTSGMAPAEYASCLLEVVRGLTARRTLPAVVTMASQPDLAARLKTVLAASKNRSRATKRGAATAALAALMVVLPLAAVRPIAAGAAGQIETKRPEPPTDALPGSQVVTFPGDTRSPKEINDWQRINRWRRTLLASPASPWKATLDNGTHVYLTSLWALNGPDAAKTWTPGGTVLADSGAGSLSYYKRFPSTFYNVDLVLMFPSDSVRRQTRVTFGSATQHSSSGTDLAAFDKNGFHVGSRRYINTGFQAIFAPTLQQADLTVSLAMGPETVLVSGSPLSGGVSHLQSGETATVTQVEVLPHSSQAEVQLRLPPRFVRNESEYKIVVIGNDGAPLRVPGGSQSYPVVQGKEATIRYGFSAAKLPLDQIKEFRLTYRPAQTVVFHNVSLHPKASAVTAAAQTATAAPQIATPAQSALLPEGTQIRLVQITPVHAENKINPYGSGWSPDGSPSPFKGVSPNEGLVSSPVVMLPGRSRSETYGYGRVDIVTRPRRSFDVGLPSFVLHGSGHADITVPLATGPYATVISGPLDRYTFLKLSSGETVTLSKAVVRPPADNPAGKRLGPVAEVRLTLPDRFLQGGELVGYRLDALDADGKPIPTLGFSGPVVVYRAYGMTQVAFDTRTAELTRLKVTGVRFGYRDVHTVLFRNVALQPAASALAAPLAAPAQKKQSR